MEECKQVSNHMVVGCKLCKEDDTPLINWTSTNQWLEVFGT